MASQEAPACGATGRSPARAVEYGMRVLAPWAAKAPAKAQGVRREGRFSRFARWRRPDRPTEAGRSAAQAGLTRPLAAPEGRAACGGCRNARHSPQYAMAARAPSSSAWGAALPGAAKHLLACRPAGSSDQAGTPQDGAPPQSLVTTTPAPAATPQHPPMCHPIGAPLAPGLGALWRQRCWQRTAAAPAAAPLRPPLRW